jgi:hypothetical protein
VQLQSRCGWWLCGRCLGGRLLILLEVEVILFTAASAGSKHLFMAARAHFLERPSGVQGTRQNSMLGLDNGRRGTFRSQTYLPQRCCSPLAPVIIK